MFKNVRNLIRGIHKRPKAGTELIHWVARVANRTETAYCLHLILAALFFSRFLLLGHILFADTDLVAENYPLLLLAKANFLHGSLGLWNQFDFSGTPMAVDGVEPIFFPENWLLFLVPKQFFFPAITFVALIKFWVIGVAAYRFFCAELLNRRWALFASVAYQLSGWTIWCVAAYVALSIYVYYTILLALIWTTQRRSYLANYMLLSIVTTMMLLAGNIAQASYALLGAGILFIYRALSQRSHRPVVPATALFTASSVTALLIFCVRLLPTIQALLSGTRRVDLSAGDPMFRNTWFLVARFFDTEIFGVNYADSQTLFKAISPLFRSFHLHWIAPSFFGVIAALLVVWALASEKSTKARFWSGYVVVVWAIAMFAQPFDSVAKIMLFPIYHALGAPILLPPGFCALAAFGGRGVERTMRRGQLLSVTRDQFIFAAGTIGLIIFMVFAQSHWSFAWNTPKIFVSSNRHARIAAIVLFAALACIVPLLRSDWGLARLSLILSLAFAAVVAAIFIVPQSNLTFVSHFRNLASGLLLFFGTAVVLDLAVRRHAAAAWRLGLWGGGWLLALCLGINLWSWTDVLWGLTEVGLSQILAGLGAVRFILALFVFFLLLKGALSRRLPARSGYAVFFLLLVAEQVPAGKVDSYINANPFYAADTLYPSAATPRSSDGQPMNLDLADYRVNFPNAMLQLPFYKQLWGATNEVCASINDAYGIRSYGGVHDTTPARSIKFLSNWADPGGISDFGIYATVTNDRFLDLSGVGYSYDRTAGTVSVRPNALSRLMLFTRFDISPSDADTLKGLKARSFAPLQEIMLQRDPGFESHSSPENGQKLRYLESSPDRIEVRVDTPGPAILFFDDSYNPGWMATVNGQSHPIIAADYNFMAVAVPPGQSHIVLRYWPRSFMMGAMLAGIALIVLAVAFVAWTVRSIPYGASSNWRPTSSKTS